MRLSEVRTNTEVAFYHPVHGELTGTVIGFTPYTATVLVGRKEWSVPVHRIRYAA